MASLLKFKNLSHIPKNGPKNLKETAKKLVNRTRNLKSVIQMFYSVYSAVQVDVHKATC